VATITHRPATPPVVPKLDSLQTRLTLLLLAAAVIGIVVHSGLTAWPLPGWIDVLRRSLGLGPAWHAPAPRSGMAVAISMALVAGFCAWAAARVLRPLRRLSRALEGIVLSYRDGDFSVSLAHVDGGELASLVAQHQALGEALREQRQHLAQRELLLDTVVQNTPVALVLVDTARRVAYANIAARHLLGEGRSLNGVAFDDLLADAPAALREVLAAGEDALFTVPIDGLDETFHVSQRAFRLQGRPHQLYLLRRMTRELSRQEVSSWKRLIRVISHELNNSLAPISSLAHSGAELARRGDTDRLPGVFASIGDRAHHLHGFLEGYARFAKLAAPRPEAIEWAPFLESLAAHCAFRLEGEVPTLPARFDGPQVEQALINLLKNAHEAGGHASAILLRIVSRPGELSLVVADRGPGMSEPVLAQALLPFYSTKRAGTGLGLALAREIVEAHGGRIALANRAKGGLRVTLTLPQPVGVAEAAAR
jgi:nitrogen fixation/metabolism regulation signal transduction histidine kinase